MRDSSGGSMRSQAGANLSVRMAGGGGEGERGGSLAGVGRARRGSSGAHVEGWE